MTIAKAQQQAQKIRDLVWDRHLPVNPATIARGLTITRKDKDGHDTKCSIIVAPGDNEDFQTVSSYVSLAIDNNTKPVFIIEYAPSEIIYRQNFAIAHSLGHIVLGHIQKDKPKIHGTYNLNKDDSEQFYASHFALALLMPEFFVRELFPAVTSIQEFAECFKVSVPAMTSRLKNLGLL